MALHLGSNEVSISYSDKFREYGILTRWDHNRSLAIQSIDYCPWCRAKLPRDLRSEWFAILDDLGLEPEDPAVPEEMKSDAWWRRRKL